MIAVLKQGATGEQIRFLTHWLEGMGLQVHAYPCNDVIILGLIGDTQHMDIQLLQSMEIVEKVQPVSEPFKQASRKFHPDDTVVTVGSAKFGGGHFSVIAGPCSVESESQIIQVAQSVKDAGAQILRGGAFKPRTSPYAFQGMGVDGLALLRVAREATGLPICTELMNIHQLELFQDMDMLQIGARNMQNFELLREVGRTHKPVLLKRGLSSTLQELLMSAEYIMQEGNTNIILCERGIRTFETATRNTLDLSAVPALQEMSHLPVVVDPSHGTGKANLVPAMALAATAAGADGLMIEVHNDPANALCDGAQSLTTKQFADLSKRIAKMREGMKQ
ncbi:MAG: 3-deoxy-7-phosphoheptulonate synthase [Ruminococcaceae bacterium]|nr:3-deoxy-7-phosphoheptulonate synthase [Oscillospiraceae bacterium]